jgi:RHS repeat-associated protein
MPAAAQLPASEALTQARNPRLGDFSPAANDNLKQISTLAPGSRLGTKNLDYMHARFHSPLTGRFLSVDSHPGHPKVPQSWNRYSYATGNPMRLVDPSGKLGLPFELSAFLVRALEYVEGFVQGARDQTGAGLGAGAGTRTTSTDYEAGRQTATLLAQVDTVIEVSATADTGFGPAVTGGVSLINGNDAYAFLGFGESQSISPLSLSFSTGVVLNYGGIGSYSGPFTGGSFGPLGVGVTGNPSGPDDNPVAVTAVVSSDLGATETLTYYIPLSAIPEEVLKKGGLFFYQGTLLRLPPKE